MSNMFNRRVGYVHLCREEGHCGVVDDVALHVPELELADGHIFQADYISSRGRQLLHQIVMEADAELVEARGREIGASKKKEKPKDNKASMKKGPGVGKGLGGETLKEDGPVGGAQALKARLAALREKECNKAGVGVPKEGLGTSPRLGEGPGTSGSAVPPALKDGRALKVAQEIKELAMRGQEKQTRQVVEPKGDTTQNLRTSRSSHSVGGQLVQQAAAKQDRRRSNRDGSRRQRSRFRKKDQRSRSRRGRRRTSGRRRRRRESPSDGSPDGSSDGSSSYSTRSRRGKKRRKRGRSSSEEDYLPPL